MIGSGFILADHVVPQGAIIVAPHFCERCGLQMYVPYGVRWCNDCAPLVQLEDWGYSLEQALRKALDDAGMELA